MRLIRLASGPARISQDIRATFTSLGRGDGVIGGIALIGVDAAMLRQTNRTNDLIDAIVLTPRGAVIVVGVDLPDLAMRLEAPLNGSWKADGWPLVRENGVNPAIEALTMATSLADRLRELISAPIPIGIVLAVGPFVEKVEQPPEDLAGPVRVLYPTPGAVLNAINELACAPTPCSIKQAQNLLASLAPHAATGHTEESLLAEGFSRVETEEPAPSAPPAPTPLPATSFVSASDIPPQRNQPIPQHVNDEPQADDSPQWTAPRSGRRWARWLPIAGVAAVAIAAGGAFAVTGQRDGDTTSPAPAVATSAGVTTAPPETSAAAGRLDEPIRFTQRAVASDQRCASHAFGDVQVSLQRTSCTGVHRGSFIATVGNRPAAVTIAVIDLANPQLAAELKNAADVPGGGGINDLATEINAWGSDKADIPTFEHAAYLSNVEGNSMRLVQAAWLTGQSTPDDPNLVRVTTTALTTPL